MTLTILASFSFLALVVSARPIVPQENNVQPDIPPSVQSAVQAYFESRTGRAPSPKGSISIRLTTPTLQQSYLEQLSQDAIKAVVPISDQKLYEALGGDGKLDELDGGILPKEKWAGLGLVVDGEDETDVQAVDGQANDGDQQDSSSTTFVPASGNASLHELLSQPPPLLLASLSVVTAGLFLACVGVSLCVRTLILRYIARSPSAWDALEKVEKGSKSRGGSGGLGGSGDNRVNVKEKGLVECADARVNEKGADGARDLIVFDISVQPEDLPLPPSRPSSPPSFDSPVENEEDQVFSTPELLPQTNFPSDFAVPDPDFLPLPPVFTFSQSRNTFPASSPAPSRYSTPSRKQLRAVAPQPQWAASASQTDLSLSIPGGLPPDEYAYSAQGGRMQVRMGDVAADPAWLVRVFVHALWGWMAVIVGGQRR